MRQLHTDAEFNNEISNGVVLVDFFATWCNPCKLLANELEQIDTNMEFAGATLETGMVNSGYKIVKVDTEELPLTTAKYGVMGLPTLGLFKNGEMIGRATGFMPKEAIINWIESNL